MHLSDKNVLKIEYKKKSFAINKFYRAISSIFYNVIFFSEKIWNKFAQHSLKRAWKSYFLTSSFVQFHCSRQYLSTLRSYYFTSNFSTRKQFSIPMKTDSIDLFLAFSRISLLPIELPFSSQLKTIAMRIIQSFNQYISLNQYKWKHLQIYSVPFLLSFPLLPLRYLYNRKTFKTFFHKNVQRIPRRLAS